MYDFEKNDFTAFVTAMAIVLTLLALFSGLFFVLGLWSGIVFEK